MRPPCVTPLLRPRTDVGVCPSHMKAKLLSVGGNPPDGDVRAVRTVGDTRGERQR